MTILSWHSIRSWYNGRDVLAGLLIYSAGDSIAALLSAENSWGRFIGIAFTGALIYGGEIPKYFRWVDNTTRDLERTRKLSIRTALAIAYFNPLWIARHLFLIELFSGRWQSVSFQLLSVSFNSFLAALPVTIIANLTIQNFITLRFRFIASAIFSCAMAIYYPLVSKLFT